jgi:hypothetical protein
MNLGISGHQDLGGSSGEEWVRQTIRTLLRELSPTLGFSSLARGSDQIFAQALLDAGIPLVTVIPSRDYRRTFEPENAPAFDRFLESASSRSELPFREPCEEAFYEAAREIVNRCDLLIAVWNGAKPKGLGGTGDAVKYAARMGKRIIHLDPILRTLDRDLAKEKAMQNARIFVSFAIEDVKYRDLLKGQAANENCPFDFTDMSVKEPWDSEWKTRCRSRIRGCDGLIALISGNTARAEGARWEMQCAREENVPMIGVHVQSDARNAIPSELADHKIIPWTWPGIDAFIQSCIP